MVEEGRRALSANPLPCPQSGFRDFRGCKSIALPIAGQNTSDYTNPPRPNQARRYRRFRNIAAASVIRGCPSCVEIK